MSEATPQLDLWAVLDAVPRAVIVSDPSGTVLLWNSAAEALYGWASSDAIGRSVLDVLVPVGERSANQQVLERVVAGETWDGDRTLLRRNGEPVRVFSIATALTNASGEVTAVVGLSVDVTGVRLAEQQSQDLSKHLRLVLDAGGLGTWRWDLSTGATVWDERLELLHGLSPGSFDGTFERYVSLLHLDDRERVLLAVQEAVAAKSAYEFEHRIVRPDGTVRWVACAGTVTIDDQGFVTGTLGCVSDVTDRVQQDLDRQRLIRLAEDAADRERVQRERLEFISAINDALNASHSREEIMANVTAVAVPRLGDWCSMHVLTPAGDPHPDVEIAHVDPSMVAYARQLQERFPYDPDALTGIANVIRTGTTEFYADIDESVLDQLEATEEERAIIDQLALRSSIAVALTKQGRIFGAMQFVMSSSSRRYTPDDVALAEAVAGRIAASLENRRLNEQHRHIAHTLQQSLLPTSLPPVPRVEIAVRYWAAGEGTEVGGDFYDVFSIDDDHWAIVIGDVCGTGPAAAALTGLARHSIRDSAWHGDTPTGVLESLNRAILRSGVNSFCTAAYAQLHRRGDTTELVLACGGHPLPVHVRHGRAETVGRPGTLLGMLAEVNISTTAIGVCSEDVVVFYTDGATDLAPPHGLTTEQFVDLVADSFGESAESVANGIHQRLEERRPFAARNDDLALLVLRFT